MHPSSGRRPGTRPWRWRRPGSTKPWPSLILPPCSSPRTSIAAPTAGAWARTGCTMPDAAHAPGWLLRCGHVGRYLPDDLRHRVCDNSRALGHRHPLGQGHHHHRLRCSGAPWRRASTLTLRETTSRRTASIPSTRTTARTGSMIRRSERPAATSPRPTV